MIVALAAMAASVVGPPAPTTERRETIAIHWDAQAKTCVPTVRGVDTGDIRTEAGARTLAAAVPDRGAAIHLRGGGSVPYDCMVAILDALRDGGHYGAIGFVAQPAP